MAQPFFNSNYGSSLMRVDNSGIQQAGQAYGQMFANLGKTIGSTIEKFREGKEKKEQQQRSEDLFLRLYETNSDNPIFSALSIQSTEEAKAVAKDISKDPKLVADAMKFGQMAMDQQKAEQATELYNRAIAADDRKIAEAQSENKFINKLFNPVPTGELNRQGEIEVENYSAFSAPNDPQIESFRKKTLADPNFQKTESLIGMADNRFLSQFQNSSPEVQARALQFIQTRKKDAPTISRVGTELNPETGEYEQIARDKFGNPIANYGPPKPSGMYPTPEDARRQEILVGRTKDAMAFNKEARNNSNIAISQAEQAQQALKYLPETTGGLTSFVNEMKVIGESLGIDLPEGYQKDMADIGAFRQLTGQFLFEAMSNTKGAITEREMKLFRQISPDIDNSRAANKLMLEIYVKAGDRAKQRRDLIRDLQKEDVDPRQIQIAIEDFDDANSLMDDIRSLPRKTNQNSQAQPNRSGVRGGSPTPNSNAQRTPGGFLPRQIK